MKWSVITIVFVVSAKFCALEETWINETQIQLIDNCENKVDSDPKFGGSFILNSPENEGLNEQNIQRHSSFLEPPGHHEIIAGVHLPASIPEVLPEIHKFWKPFKEVHNKLYLTLRDMRRKRQWVENLIRVHEHNEEARKGRYGYYLRANHLSDLNIREYIKRMIRLTKSERDPTMPSSSPATYVKRNINVPEEWNWLEQGFVTPSWDQANCGSCYAFSIAASAQGQYFRKTGQLRNLSTQQIVDCSVMSGNWGCYGGSLRNALRYCLKAGGLMTAEEYPYRARQRLCRYRPWHSAVNVTSYVILPEYDEEAIQEAVATVGPVACSIDASPYTFQLYHKGIYDDPSCSSHKVNHAMLIVGYTKDAWILKNWWGEHWGMDGYMYLKKGVNQCAVAKYVGYPVVDEVSEETGTWRYTGHCPTLKFRFGKRYGADTKEIIEQLRDVSPVQLTKPYKEGDPELSVLRNTVREKGEEIDPIIYSNQPRRPFILGYTGFIPGLNFEYGIPFSSAAQKSLMKFTRRLADEERKRQKERMQFLNTAPKMYCVRNKDEVSRAFEENTKHFYNRNVPPVMPEFPPIAGYTGHIPKMKGNEASLSQRYYSAAKAGLSMLRQEKIKRNQLNLAKEAVADAITYSHIQ